MLVKVINVGDRIVADGRCSIKILRRSGTSVRVSISAEPDVKISIIPGETGKEE